MYGNLGSKDPILRLEFGKSHTTPCCSDGLPLMLHLVLESRKVGNLQTQRGLSLLPFNNLDLKVLSVEYCVGREKTFLHTFSSRQLLGVKEVN